MSFISYAQNYEDVMLFRALKDVEKGFYIDVGAQDPVVDSVTRAFYERGWRGINIEPTDEYQQKLAEDRPNDINLKIAASSNIGELTFHEFPHTGLSTTSDEYAAIHQEAGFEGRITVVPCTTLDAICQDNDIQEVHFLKIDVEGSEREVLEGFSFESVRPWILVVEATAPLSTEDTSANWEQLVLEKDYEFTYFDGLNRFFVAKEHTGLMRSFKVPPNIFDGYVTYPLWWSQEELSRVNALLENANKEKGHLIKSLERSQAVLAEQQVYSQWLQNEWDVAKARLEEFAGEIATAKTNAVHLSTQLSERTEALERTQAALAEQQAHSQCLQNEWDVAKVRLEKLAVELATAKTNAAHLSVQLNEKTETLEGSQAALAKQQAHSQWLQNEWDAAKGKIDELNHSSHHWWTVADGLIHELQTVYKSKSWRITWPLRKLMQFFKWLFYLPVRFTIWLVNLPKRTARWMLVKMMAFALRRPGLKVRAMTWLSKYPRIEARLRKLAQARGLVANSSFIPIQPDPVPATTGDEVAASSVDLSHLTPSARRIYGELKAAIAQRYKENG